ncbi:YheC/YheD family protein [Bacillus horti]|uniref:Glutathione synthase/RimK-type ligase-like ATP-grasp enzyme n=1 Tax=Caldalkalibacillus horti TaxID=77523 RepID=A0ABT9VW10_9BACI|nr:YheC/YheD family protein [Bacillus horti]MDQ0165186.1 glutathione synthase/RimK-type ligase-like ATP-grasp enzyme [Bacillus horti]
MTDSKVIISHTPDSSHGLPMINIPAALIKKLRIPYDYPLQLQFSTGHNQVLCRPLPYKLGHVQVDEKFAKHLGIPDQCQLQISYSPITAKLKLGPVLAILVSKISKSHPPYFKLNPFFEEVILYARNRHILPYVTSIDQLLKGTDKIMGWVFSKGSWTEEVVPYPQIIYNRIGSRKVENSHAYRDLKELLEKKKVHLFNQTFLDKWEVYDKLSEDRAFSPYLPQTKLFGANPLRMMLSQYSTVYVKPIHGSLGNGIYKISKHRDGYITQYSTRNGQIHKQFAHQNQLYSYLSKRVSTKKHIIQEGIPLLQFQERTVDFRALMQKNKLGKWSVTSMVARVGPLNRFVSNIARGGEIVKVNSVLSACGFKEPKIMRQQLIHVAKKTCEGIENSYKDQFGELGVDLGLDKQGRIYLLEINSKPSKTEDTIPSIETKGSKGRPSVHRLLDYTQFLSNQLLK